MFGSAMRPKRKEMEVAHRPDGSVLVRPSDVNQITDYSKKRRLFETEPSAEGDIPLAQDGPAAAPPVTLIQLMQRNASEKGSLMALQWEDATQSDAPLVGWTWAEYYTHIRAAAKAMIAVGVCEHECVCLIGFNAKEWFCVQLGAMFAGGMAAGIYSTNNSAACEYIVKHCGGRVVFADTCTQLQKFAGLQLPSVAAFVLWGGECSQDLAQQLCAPVMSYGDFVARGSGVTDQQLATRMDAVRPGHCAVLVYTSGTTGNPKACMLSHDNLVFSATAAFLAARPEGLGEEAMVSYLPLSHSAGLQLDIVGPAVVTAQQNPTTGTRCNMTITFARPDALKGSLGETLKKVRPTIFFGVPRVYEKIMERIEATSAKRHMGVLTRAFLDWAKGRAWKRYVDRFAGGPGGDPLGYGVAHRLVLSKVHRELGLDRCHEFCFTGAAPIGHHVLEFFARLGINVKELFGLSETAAAGCVSSNKMYKLGAVGSVVGGTEAMLLHVADRDQHGHGELCMRGRHVMLGYLKDEEKTRDTIDEHGWLHSGDVATVDEAGLISITGRVKELLVTAGGENIAPDPIEHFIKRRLPCVSNCMVVGDRLKFLSLLVTLKTHTDPSGDNLSNNLAEQAVGFAGSHAKTVEEARENTEYMSALDAAIREYNNSKAVSDAQKVKKFRVLDHDFSIAGGELTVTLKVRRSEVAKKYRAVIDDMYAEDRPTTTAA